MGTSRLASLGVGYSRAEAAGCQAVAAEGGVNLIDTADSYGGGDCERLLRHLLADFRHPFFLSTKAGFFRWHQKKGQG